MNIIVIVGVIATAIGAYYGYRQYRLAEKPGETAEQRPTPGAVPTATFTPVSEATPTPMPFFTPSPSPALTSGPAPAPTPHPPLKTEPEQKPSPTPLLPEPARERVPEPKPTEESFVRRIPQNPCIKDNHADDLSLGVPYRDVDVGFFVEYIAASAVTGVNLRIKPMVLLQMPGEEKTREVNVYPALSRARGPAAAGTLSP